MSFARCIRLLLVSCALVGWSASSGLSSAVAQDPAHNEAHAEEHAEAHGAGAAGAPDPLSVDPDLAIWTFVVFVILLIVLKKFAWGPILGGLERREQSIADHIAQAERNHAEARRLLADYEAKLANAAAEVRAMLDEARRDGEHTKQSILAEAKTAADAERARALRDIDAAADAAMESLAQRSAQLAVDLAGRILQSKLNGDDHAKLIQEAMKKIPAAAGRN